MSLANTTRVESLEYRFEQMRLMVQQLAQAVDGLQSQLANMGQGDGGQGGGGAVTYIVSAPSTPISANGGTITNQTVSVCYNTALVTISTTATIYNWMQAATVASNTLIVGPNPDGTYTAISQSC